MGINDADKQGILNIKTGAYIYKEVRYIGDWKEHPVYYIGYTNTNKNDHEIILYKNDKKGNVEEAYKTLLELMQEHGAKIIC